MTTPTPSRSLGALLGVASAVAGLGVAELVAGASADLRSPVLTVGDRAVDLVPPALKDLAIRWFGTADKVALLVGIGVVIACYAALLGVLAARGRRGLATLGIVGFGLVGSAAALTDRAGSRWWSVIPTLVGSTVAAIALLRCTATTVSGAPTRTFEEGRPNSRRRFVASSVVLVGVGTAAAAVGRRLDGRFGAAASRAEVVLPTPATPAPAVPAGASLAAEGLTPLFTPNRDFYRIDTALTVPQVPLDTWSLTITGLVERELRLDWADLLDRPLVESDITLTCVSNLVGGDLLGTARWLGVRLDDLLAEAGIDPAADQIVGRSVDGYTCGFPVAALDGRDALVAVAMNGEPLPLEHGFPARLIVPGLYGYVSATKWLTEIELTTFEAFDSYWVPRGYAAEAPIRIQSRIDTPKTLSSPTAGSVGIGGMAWAQPVGVARVEVRIDDGAWIEAELGAEVNESTWRQWHLAWDATPGRHSITVRATDHAGTVQEEERRDPLPDGATGLHTIVVTVPEA